MTNPDISTTIKIISNICKESFNTRPELNENYIKASEDYYGFTIPESWRSIIKEFTYPPKNIPFHLGTLDFDPMNAAEHQVETDDGKGITIEDYIVIAYLEGIGDSIIIRKEYADNPMVYFHDHSSKEKKELGKLSSFLDKIAKLMKNNPYEKDKRKN